MEKRLCILNVEDEKVDHMALQRMVREKNLPYDIEWASLFGEALKMLKDNRYDLIILDYMMPDGDGLQLLEKIEETPSLFLTGSGDERIAVKAMKGGAYDYLIKDPERAYLELLPVTIERILLAHQMEEKQKKTEDALRRSEEYARNIVDSSIDMIIAVDRDRRIIEFNSAAEKTFQYSRDEIIGQHIDILYADPKKEGQLVHEETALNGCCVREIMNRRKNGEQFPAFLSASLLKDSSGEVAGYMGVSRDITETKTTQKMLLQSAKLASLGELAANIAHEINNPMTAVLGYTSFLLEDMEEGGDYYESLKTIERESLRVRDIVRNLLDFARKDVTRKVETDVGEIIDDTLSLVNHMADLADIRIEKNYKENLPKVIVDTNQIKQVFINLINNACHAMQGGGKLLISTDVETEREDGRDYIKATFKDNGCGIPNQALGRLFEPFYTTKGDKGTGLGLSVSYSVVKDQGGDIFVKSEEGKGSEFTVLLPIANEVLI